MKTLKQSLLILTTLIFVACGGDGDSNDPIANDNDADSNKYSGAGTYGDLLTFSINQKNETYALNNETTGKTESGSYDVMSLSGLEGVYKVSAGGSNFFGIELDDKIAVGNFPSGNAQNDITFGVSSEIDNSSKTNEIAGNYIYIRLGNVPINGSSDFKEVGFFTLTASGKINLIDFASGGNGNDSEVVALEDLDSWLTFPIDDSYDYYLSGTWALNGTKKDRFDVTVDGVSATGFAYAAGSTTVFLIDLGTGNGFAIGYKITNTSLASIAGSYKFIDTWSDNSRGAGNYTISSNGNIQYTYTTNGTATETGSFGPLSKFNLFTNVYYKYAYDGDNDIFLVIAGDAIMHFIFDEDGRLQAYGCGAKI